MRKALFVQHTNPGGYPPIQHAIAMLIRAGWEVKCVGVGIAATVSLSMPNDPQLTVLMMRPTYENSILKLFQRIFFCLWVGQVALRWRPELIYTSDAYAAPAGLLAASLTRSRIVYHEHDSPAEPETLYQKVVVWCRRIICNRALVVVTPNATRSEEIILSTGISAIRVVTVLNCLLKSEMIDELPIHSTIGADAAFRVYYHGSIVRERIPLAIVDALASLPRHVCLRIVGYETLGSLGYCDELYRRAVLLGVIDRIEFVGSVPRTNLLRFARSSHLGLSLMPMQSSDVNMTHMVGASNKPFDYLASGCPLVVSDLPEWRANFVDTGLASCCDPQSSASIANAISYWLTQPEKYRKAKAEGLRRIATEWNYETQFAPVLNAIQGGVKLADTTAASA